MLPPVAAAYIRSLGGLRHRNSSPYRRDDTGVNRNLTVALVAVQRRQASFPERLLVTLERQCAQESGIDPVNIEPLLCDGATLPPHRCEHARRQQEALHSPCERRCVADANEQAVSVVHDRLP